MKKLEDELLEKVKFLLDENEYYADMQDEVNEELLEIDEEMKVFLNLYNEYNRKNNDKGLELKRCEKELKAIVEKQERLNGRITKKDNERKQELEALIQTLKVEKENDKKNREDARKAFHKIMDSNPSFNNSLRINEYQSKIEQNIAQLQEIYNNCKEAVGNLDNQIQEAKQKMKEAAINNDDEVLFHLSAELVELTSQKDSVYNKYQEIIRLIESKQVLNIQEPVVSTTKVQQTELSEDEIKEKMAEAARIVEEREKGKTKETKASHNKTNEMQNNGKYKGTKVILSEEELNGRIFTDESRIDKDRSWMNASNASNTDNLDKKEEEKSTDKESEVAVKDVSVDAEPVVDVEPIVEELTEEEIKAKMAEAVRIAKERDLARAAQAEAQSKPDEEIEDLEDNIINETQKIIQDQETEVVEEEKSDKKRAIVEAYHCVVGKIKNIAKLPKHLNELVINKIKARKVRVNAGTEESLEEQDKLSR